ncbi:NIPSNAP family protein [Candidatus Omnitrophota bacterium]
MINILITMEVPRHKVDEILYWYGKELFPWEEENFPKVGGRILGVWSTMWGEMGEITILSTYPNEEARRIKGPAMHADNEEISKKFAKWQEYTPKGNRRVMRPAPYSPLQGLKLLDKDEVLDICSKL